MLGITTSRRGVGHARALLAALAMLAALAIWAPSAAHASGCTDSWTNAAGGSWFNGANWSTKAAPSSSDEACIALAGTYTVEMPPKRC